MCHIESNREQLVCDEFLRMGWNLQIAPRFRVHLSPSEVFIPDIALYSDKEELIAIVEVIANKEQTTLKRIDILERMIKLTTAPIVIITNGYAYDIYTHGQFATQTVFCPSLDTCRFLLRQINSINEEGGDCK